MTEVGGVDDLRRTIPSPPVAAGTGVRRVVAVFTEEDHARVLVRMFIVHRSASAHVLAVLVPFDLIQSL